MKTKVKRISKRSLAMLIGVLMLVTSIGLGTLITASATTYYAFYDTSGSKNMSNSTAVTMTDAGDGTYYCSFTTSNNNNFSVTVCTSNPGSTSTCQIDTSTTKGTTSGVTIHNAHQEGSGYQWTIGWATSGTTVYFIFNPTANTVSASTTAPTGGGGETPDPDPDPDPEPTPGGSGSLGDKVTSGSNLEKILKETDIAVYLYGYTGNDNNQSLSTSSNAYKEGTIITNEYSYIQIAKTDLSRYYYITNHKGDWPGNQNYALKTATNGGAVYDGRNSYTSSGGVKDAAKTGSTSITNGSTFYNANNLNISTSVNSTTMSYSSDALQLCYYVKDSSDNFYELTDMTGLEVSAANTAQTYNVSLAGFAAGSYTLYTVAKSGSRDLWYILDKNDTFTVTAVDTETIRSNLIIFNNKSSNAIVRGWLWKDSGSGTNKNFTTKGTYSSKALSYYNNSSTGYNKGIGFTSSASEGGSWSGTGQVTGDITGSNVSTDGNRYYYNSSTAKDNGEWTAFAHIGDTIELDKSTVGVGDTVKISNTITGTLFNGSGGATSASVTYYYINNANNTKTTIGTDATATNSTKKSFSIDTAGTYTVVAYVSDQWGFEKTMTNVATLTVVPKHTITTNVTTDSKYGTISTDLNSAIAGETVTITISEGNGTLDEISAEDAGGNTVALEGEGSTRTFTMPASNVTVTASFDNFIGNSDFYYNGYNYNSSTGFVSEKSGYYGKKMSERMVGGKEYSYYHVTDRTETNQYFSVSYGNVNYNSCYIYFQIPNDWTAWSPYNSPKALFLSSDEQRMQYWTYMDFDSETNSKQQYKIKVPKGAKYAYFQNNNNSNQTIRVELTGSNNAWYLSGGTNGSGEYNVTGFKNTDYLGTIGDVHEYFGGVYNNHFNTSGFTSNDSTHYGSDSSIDHTMQYPSSLTDYKEDYYILVFYKDVTYTFNGETYTPSGNPTVVWSPFLPGDAEESIPVYVKDGAVNNKTASAYSDKSIGMQYGKTLIDTTDPTGISSITTNTYYQTAQVEVDVPLKITTTISGTVTTAEGSENAKDLYYVKAFSINGQCYDLNEWNSSGVYSTTYTVKPSDTYLEVTPIYYLKDSSDTTTFYIESFNDTVKGAGWGETLYVYPFYTNPSKTNVDVAGGYNAFGSYPGQPVINYGGKYYAQIPKSHYTKDEQNAYCTSTIEGVVISNGYYDTIHTELNEYTGVSSHKQTYDFKDFFTIDAALHPDNIVYNFKYRTSDDENNHKATTGENRATVDARISASYSTTSAYNSGSGEFLKDKYGRYIDIFGNVLSTQPGSAPDSGFLSVYSYGYVENPSGHYGTEWAVYNTSGNLIKYANNDCSIIPSALYFSSSSELSSYGLGDYVNMYDTLNTSTYKDKPVKIFVEKEIGIDKADRSDGIWMHSSNNDVIHADIEMQFSTDNGETYGTATNNTYGGYSISGVSATFTNDETNIAGTSINGLTSTGNIYSNSSKDFTFKAVQSGQWVFKEWTRVDVATGSESFITSNLDGSSSMTSIDKYVARFIYVTSGVLNLGASMTNAYTGLGTPKIGVEVLSSSDEVLKTYALGTSNISIGSFYIKSSSTGKIRVTLQTVASGDYRFGSFSSSAGATFFGGSDSKSTTNYTNDTGTRTFTFNISSLFSGNTQNVISINYMSALDKGTAYTVEYNYTGLGGASKTYTTKAYSFETITNGTNVTSLTVGNRGTTFQTWIRNHVPVVNNTDYDQTWTIGTTLTYTNNKISITAASNAKTYTVIEDIDGETSTASGLAKDAYSSGTRTLTCPEAIKSSFKYWSVHNLTKTGTKGNIEMARCYSYDFTLQLTGDSYISLETVSDDSNPALLSDPIYSREIYTNGENTVDKVYVDFILAYMNKEISLKEDELGSNTYRSGIIVEFNEKTTVSSAYNGETFISDDDQVRTFASGEAANLIYNAEGQSGRNAMVRFTANDSNYNNFNRLDYRLGFNNNTSWMTRVMKAYYYVTDGTNVYLSDPVYFCLYDTSVAVYEE